MGVWMMMRRLLQDSGASSFLPGCSVRDSKPAGPWVVADVGPQESAEMQARFYTCYCYPLLIAETESCTGANSGLYIPDLSQ